MKKGYVFANTKITLTSLEDYFSVLPDFEVTGSLHLSIGEEILVGNKPDVIFLSDEFVHKECENFLDRLENTQLYENVSIFYVVFELSESQMQWLLEEKRIDFWLPFNASVFERKYCIEKALKTKEQKKLLHHLQMQNTYLQSTLTNYEQKAKYQQKSIEKEYIQIYIDFIQSSRGYLSTIEGALSILAQSSIDNDSRTEAVKVLKNNAKKFIDFLEEKSSFYEEKKLLTNGIKIATVSKVMSSMREKIVSLAQQKSVQLKIHTDDMQQIIVGRREDFLYVVETIVSSFINLIKPNSKVDFYVRTTESALLVDFYLETSEQSLHLEEVVDTFGKDNVCRRMLDSIGAQFEFLHRDQKVGIKFYLPRLS
ncbi:MAG: hypothetical protein PHX86_05290 [Caldisericia bacterium]|nr:hypothetical protein [Caldisericia bacterium]